MKKQLFRVYEAISDGKPIAKEDAAWLFDEYYKYSDALIDRFILDNDINEPRGRIVRLLGKYFWLVKSESDCVALELEAKVNFETKQTEREIESYLLSRQN